MRFDLSNKDQADALLSANSASSIGGISSLGRISTSSEGSAFDLTAPCKANRDASQLTGK